MLAKPVKTISAPSTPALTRIYAWFSALLEEDVDLLNDLNAHGIPVDVFHPLRHTTALMEATRLGRTAIVDWLLQQGAAPAFLCGMPLGTPLHCALRRRQWSIAERLLDAMENASVVDANGCTPLHILCMEAQPEQEPKLAAPLCERLVEKKCPLDALDHEGITALHHCVINNTPKLAERLLEHGANPNALVPDSWVSPLAIAALEKNLRIAELLIAYGADPHLKMREGSSPAAIYPSILKSCNAST